jgi:long-chain acyl-CoA synthetase
MFFLRGESTMPWGSLLSSAALQNPNREALIFGRESVSYEQFDQAATSLARWFLDRGCQPGDRIALYWPNSIAMAKLMFACFKAGLVATPINISMKVPEIAYVLSHCGAVMCMVHPDFALTAREAARGCPSLRAIHSRLEEADERDSGRSLPSVDKDDPALILYTSGTTARPKGVTHTHKSMLEMVKLSSSMTAGTQRVLLMTQMSYIVAIGGCFLTAIYAGATTVIAPAFEAALILDLLEEFRCDYMFGLPSMAQFMIEEQAARPRDVRSLRTFLVGGDSVAPSTQERFQSLFGIPLREAYGMTETGGSIVNPEGAVRSGSLGKAIDGVQVRLVDGEGRDVAEGQTGEIIVQTPACFTGYWDNPAATADAVRDGWLYSGDRGHRDAQGYIWFDGRKKETIVRGGYNISPQEVEEAMYEHPAVLEVAVIGLPDPVYGERVVAYVTLRDGPPIDEQELKEHTGERLAELKVPEKIVFVPSLPKGITGKIQRRLLKELSLTATVESSER